MRCRVVKEAGLDPSDNRHTYYVLDCGHVVRRRTQGWKRWAECGECDKKPVDFADNLSLDSATREGAA